MTAYPIDLSGADAPAVPLPGGRGRQGQTRRGRAKRGQARQGRPLRFLLVVALGWIAVRAALLWPDPVAVPVVVAGRIAAAGRVARVRDASAPVARGPLAGRRIADRGAALLPLVAAGSLAAARAIGSGVPVAGDAGGERRAVARSPAAAAPMRTMASPAAVRALAPPPSVAAAAVAGEEAARPVATALPVRSRWSGGGWALLRGAGDAGGVATPQLGGSQAGARLAYRLDAAGRLAAVGRVAVALGTRQQEAAIGVEWQPTRLPLRLVAERRIGIAGIRGGPALGLVGGVDAVRLGAGLSLAGYAQGGVIARHRADGYVDGAATVSRPVVERGALRLELGLGAWGAAQRGAARLDLGPAAVVVLPVERHALRLGLQWRARVAGNARPGSGAVLSLGTDF